MPPNDYKVDIGKGPVHDSVLTQFPLVLVALARMAEDMVAKHKLRGATDPYGEWRHLPDGEKRLRNAGARHGLLPLRINVKDGMHLHGIHELWNKLAAMELHLEGLEAARAKLEAKLRDDPLPVRTRPSAPEARYWTGCEGTWLCTCGAGREAACICARVP